MNPAHPLRPSFGSPCTNCGECCADELCPVGSALFQRASGPCPALGYDVGGRSFCGLIVNPAHFAPIKTAINGEAAMREGFKILCGAGIGCDAIKKGETVAPSVKAKMVKQLDAVPRAAVRAARRAWGV